MTAPHEADPKTRALDAARELAEAGGYEAVHIRDVVRMTGLSSATIYRYFTSKDHLIAELWLDFVRPLESVDASTFDAPTGIDRIARLVHLCCRMVIRSPGLGKAMVHAHSSGEESVGGCRAESYDVVFTCMRRLLHDEPIDVESFLLVLGLTWEGAMVSWRFGTLTDEQLDKTMQDAVHIVAGGLRSGRA